MSDRPAKDALFDAFAAVAKALGNGRRAEIVDVLAQGERRWRSSPARSARASPTPRTTCGARHAPGCCAPGATAHAIIYRLASDRVGELWAAVRDVAAAHVAEVDGLGGRLPRRPRRHRAGHRPRRSSPSGCTRRRGRARRAPRARVRRRPHRRRPVIPPSTSSPAPHAQLPAAPRSSPTAAARTACTPTTPCGCCATGASARAGWTTASPSGGGPGLPVEISRKGSGLMLLRAVPERRQLVRQLPVRVHDARDAGGG